MNFGMRITNRFSGYALGAPASLPARLCVSETREQAYRRPTAIELADLRGKAALSSPSPPLEERAGERRLVDAPTLSSASTHHLSQFKFVLALSFSALALASSLVSARAESLLLTGANVHTISGDTLSPGQVLVENGKISAVGSTLSAAGARVIELKGQHLYPGLIALNTLLGLTEISGVRSTQDSTESGEYTPDVESWIAVNPDSELIPVTRANGIAYFEPVPEGGLVSGQSGIVATEGWTSEQR